MKKKRFEFSAEIAPTILIGVAWNNDNGEFSIGILILCFCFIVHYNKSINSQNHVEKD